MIEYCVRTRLDPLYLEETFFPLGFPLRILTNSEAVLKAARAEWSPWQRGFDEPPLTLRIEVSGRGPGLPPPARFHADHHLFTFAADGQNAAVCDTRSRTGSAWLTEDVVEDQAYFRYHFLEATVYQLVASLYLTPIHAACVARSRAVHGVLLCGDSKAGKSTLAYACARRGWTYVTDDASYLIRRRAAERLVVGNAHRIRMRPDTKRMFPELAGHAAAARGNGKLSLEVWTREVGSMLASPTAEIDRMVFLRRTPGGKPRRKPFGKLQARAWCERVFYHWDPPVAAEQRATLSTLMEACEIQALEYSDIEGAVDALER